MFQKLDSAEGIKNWARLFLNLELPLEITDPESNSSPLDAIWQIYNTFKNNSGDVTPGYILMSCREGMKTVSVAILEMLLLLHFELDIGHAAAIEDQSSIALGYINGFIMNITPLIEVSGWTKISENKRLIKYQVPSGKQPFIKIVICNPKGMNSLHANVLFLDELDLADPAALKEGLFITGYSKGWNGVEVFLSTRKYAFGNMAKAIDTAAEKNYKILRWNILDVTERCPATRYKPEGEKKDRYVAKALPLQQVSVEDYNGMPDVEKSKFDLIKDAYEGCQSCALLPVCRMRLSEKPITATGGFYKPITTILQSFRKSDPDSAEAQLLCWKPGSEGLVYKRFTTTKAPGKDSNVLTLKEAYEKLVGPTARTWISEMDLLHEMRKAGVKIVAGVDWGYTHPFVIIIYAILVTGEVWCIDCYSAPGLEFPDMLNAALTFRDKYDPEKWWCDQQQPSHIKSFNKNRMKSPKFTKDVMGGIESMRSKITTGDGKKLFKIIETPNTAKVKTAFQAHRFKLDPQGNVTLEPDDTAGIADICDAGRYIGQNEFPVKGPQKPEVSWTDVEDQSMENQNPTDTDQMKEEIAKRIADTGQLKGGTGKKGGFHWNI